MSKEVNPIPEGFHTLTPFLSFKSASKAIKFYKEAFGAIEIERHDTPDEKVMHAVIKIGDSLIMLADEFPEHSCGIMPPESLKGTTVMLHLYVKDVDTVFNQAIEAGAKVNMPLADMFWGDRYGQLQDPFGHLWSLATHTADPTPEEMDKGAQECMSNKKC